MTWQKAKNCLKDQMSDDMFSLWIKPLKHVRQENNCLYLAGPDRYFIAFVKQNYLSRIKEAVASVDPAITSVIFCDSRKPSQIAHESLKSPQQLRLPTVPQVRLSVRSLHPRYTFSEFMVGQSNILAESACRSISANDDSVGPCLYISSETGLGKSHLTHAVAHHVLDQSPMTRLHYVTAQQFAAEMVSGIQNNNMEIFKSKYQDNCDILLVEDVHSLKGKKKTQEELNEVLDVLIKSGKRVILTANGTPRELTGIDGEFRSRMSCGLVTTIQAPDIKTRSRIIERKAIGQKVSLDKDMVQFLAQNIKGDVRQIESAINAIGARARLVGGQVQMDMIREVISSIIGSCQTLSSELIRELISAHFQVGVDDLLSRSRKKSIALPRQIGMYLSRKYTDESLAEIGRSYKRDHSTVSHSIKAITDKVRRDASLSAQVSLLGDKVKQI